MTVERYSENFDNHFAVGANFKHSIVAISFSRESSIARISSTIVLAVMIPSDARTPVVPGIKADAAATFRLSSDTSHSFANNGSEIGRLVLFSSFEQSSSIDMTTLDFVPHLRAIST